MNFSAAYLSETQAVTQVLKGLDHHALFILLIQLCLLLAFARMFGELMRKFNQPPVIGELVAGVILGPSVFGAILPDLQAIVFPQVQAQVDLLAVIAWMGVLFLLVVTGLETDLNLIVRKGKSALIISLGGIILPFASGLLMGWLMPSSFLAQPQQRLIFSLFIAVAMSISAVPVIAKVLIDLRLIRRDIGQVTLAAAMTDDTIGWILLSIVAGLATRGQVELSNVLRWAGGALLFLLAAFTIGRPLVARIIRLIDTFLGGPTTQLSTILVLAFGAASLTHQMGIEAVLGAFVVGILVGESPRFRREVGHTLELITAGFLAPIFFASAGLRVNLQRLFDPEVLAIGGVVLFIACIGKFVGVYIGAWAGGLSHWERLALGSGMNARGAMEIIVATVGLSLGVLTPEMYSIIVMVAIVTSLMAPPLLRWTLSKVQMSEEETQRLEREEMAARSFVRSIQRVLLACGLESSSHLAARLVQLMSQGQPIEVTIMHRPVQSSLMPPRWKFWQKKPRHDRGVQHIVTQVRDELRGSQGSTPDIRVVADKNFGNAVVEEATRGYDLVVMEASGQSESGRLRIGPWLDRVVSEAAEVADPRRTVFENWIDHVVQNVTCSTLVIKSRDAQKIETPKRILVPTAGSNDSKQAVELAAVITAAAGGLLTIVHVVNRLQVNDLLLDSRSFEYARSMGELIVERHAEVAQKFGAKVKTVVLEGHSPDSEILKLANTNEHDLIVMGSNLRHVSGRAFFGHRVDNTLSGASCPVVVVSS